MRRSARAPRRRRDRGARRGRCPLGSPVGSSTRRSGIDSAPQCPPAGRSAAPGSPIGRRISLERRSGGVSRGRRRLHRPVRGVIDAPNSARVARHQRLDVPLPACLDRSGGPSSRPSAGPRRRPGTPATPPAPPLSSRTPARAGEPIGTRARAFRNFTERGSEERWGRAGRRHPNRCGGLRCDRQTARLFVTNRVICSNHSAEFVPSLNEGEITME